MNDYFHLVRFFVKKIIDDDINLRSLIVFQTFHQANHIFLAD
jgi:hypothetical protein